MQSNLRENLSCYQEVTTRNEQRLISNKSIKIKFQGHFYRFEQFEEVINQEEYPSFWQILSNESDEAPDLVIKHFYDETIQQDGFYLDMNELNEVLITTSNLRGLKYGIKALNKVIKQKNDYILINKVSIRHEPSFAIRGVIEGFYGVPWQHEERLNVLNSLSEFGLNTYMYAPKDDELQRKKWRELYDQHKLAEFQELLSEAASKKIDFYYMISPGNDIDLTKIEDIKALLDKLEQLMRIGVTKFGLLMDDIDYILKNEMKLTFNNAAYAHSFLINQVNAFLKEKLAEYQLIVCPTEYDNEHGSEYLKILTNETDKGIPFFWTGPNTLSGAITKNHIAEMAAVYKRPMIIWDNVPVNDYQKDHELLFLSPYENRSPFLADKKYNCLGIVSNPMAQWECSKIAVGTMAHYLWNTHSYQSDTALSSVLRQLFGDEHVAIFKELILFHPNKYMTTVYTEEVLYELENSNQDFVTEKLEKLLSANKIMTKKINNKRMLAEYQPWRERVTKDLELWQLVLENKTEEIEKKQKKLASYPHRTGLDLVAKYIELNKRNK